jgi:DNA-binding transcriptional ArsR family regulator
MDEQTGSVLLNFFRALADETRIKLVATLMDGEWSISELARVAEVRESDVMTHLGVLQPLNLIIMKEDGSNRYFSLNRRALINLKREVFARVTPRQTQADDSGGDLERQVMTAFFDGDRLRALPVGEKKMLVVLKWFAAKFAPGVEYPERDVNAIIMRHHPDTAAIRRAMVDYKLMRRERGIYWRVPDPGSPEL